MTMRSMTKMVSCMQLQWLLLEIMSKGIGVGLGVGYQAVGHENGNYGELND